MIDHLEEQMERLSQPPKVEWTDDLVAEVCREVWRNRSESDTWTSDLTAERSIVSDFIFQKRFESLLESNGVDKANVFMLNNTFSVTGDFVRQLINLVKDHYK